MYKARAVHSFGCPSWGSPVSPVAYFSAFATYSPKPCRLVLVPFLNSSLDPAQPFLRISAILISASSLCSASTIQHGFSFNRSYSTAAALTISIALISIDLTLSGMSTIPSPPSDRGLVACSRGTRSGELFYRNGQMTLFISVSVSVGIGKTLAVYTVLDTMHVLITSALPRRERVLAFHKLTAVFNFRVTFCHVSFIACCISFPTNTPRYAVWLTHLNDWPVESLLLHSPSPMAHVFSLFSLAPDSFSKCWIVFSTSLISSSDSTPKAVSSANWEILNRWFLPVGIPLIFLFSLIALTNISAPKTYSSGDSVHPWRTPRDTRRTAIPVHCTGLQLEYFGR